MRDVEEFSLVPCQDIALAVFSAMIASTMGLEALSIWEEAIAVLHSGPARVSIISLDCPYDPSYSLPVMVHMKIGVLSGVGMSGRGASSSSSLRTTHLSGVACLPSMFFSVSSVVSTSGSAFSPTTTLLELIPPSS